MNFLPEKLSETGDYNCTWGKQYEMAKRAGIANPDSWDVRDALRHDLLFEDDYYHESIPKSDRAGMYLVIDDSWDIPFGRDIDKNTVPFGAVDPDISKFPGYGDTPAERFRTLDRNVKALGYCGTGLWISCQQAYEKPGITMDEHREYWKKRASWCEEAGIRYWKIDWGRHDRETEYREMMTRVLKEYAPGIIVEHPFRGTNGIDQSRDEKILEYTRRELAFSDAYRLMDVMPCDWDTIGISRAHIMLSSKTEAKYGTRGMPQGEDCYVMCAVLGFTTGVLWPYDDMRIPLLWHRIAPPFTVYESDYTYSSETIHDAGYNLDRNHWLYGKYDDIYHPAVMCRGCGLPEVHPCFGVAPTVCASKNPRTGVYSLGTFARKLETGMFTPVADITFSVGSPETVVGLFGPMGDVTLKYETEIKHGSKVMLQNIFDTEAQDITEMCGIEGSRLTLDGRRLRRIWSESENSKGTVSQMIKVIQKD